MSTADRFDQIAAGAWSDTDAAVQKYHAQMRAITDRLRISAENAGHRRGVTREALADYNGILLPADDIDLSPHMPAWAAVPDAAAPEAIVEVATGDRAPTPDVGLDFSFGVGWLSDR